MKTANKFLFFLLLALSLAGCAGPPAQYYTLSKQSPAQPMTPTSSARQVLKDQVGPYALSDISVPAEVDNVALVVRQGNGRLMVLSDDRWTGPLSAQLSTALSQILAQSIGMPPVQKLTSESAGNSVTKIQLAVQRFDLIPGQSVTLDANWSIRFPSVKAPLTCYTRLSQPVSIGVSALVTGQQENVQALAEQLTQALNTQKAPLGSTCNR